MLIEIHMLKNYPPTNLNRDDLGTPKTCYFGGTNRGRISSQCLKRSWRRSTAFEEAVGKENLGIRTRKMPLLVKEKLLEMGVSEEVAQKILPQLSAIGNNSAKPYKDPTKTAQIAMYSNQDIEEIAKVVKNEIDMCETEKKIENIKSKTIQEKITNAGIRPVSLDIALFGRMVTTDAFRDVEGAVQVAHAISTNRVIMESDYFTAMDDLVSGKSQDDAGAAMIDNTEYNSSCYYIYASIDTDILEENLKGLENVQELKSKAVAGMIVAMAFSDPSGKQHAFAGHILPSAVLVECKDKKIPVSYTNAFAKAIYPDEKGDLIYKSILALLGEQGIMKKDFALPSKASYFFCSSRYKDIPVPDEMQVCHNYDEVVKNVIELL